MRSIRSSQNLLALSANTAETAINTEQTLDTTFLVGAGDIFKTDPRREDNADEANGKEEADVIYALGGTVGVSLNFERMQAQHAAMMLAFGLGSVATSAAGTGYAHTITPIDGDLDINRSNPSMTGIQRLGDAIQKTRWASLFVNSVKLNFAADAWVKGQCDIIGTGKKTANITNESISALDNVTQLTLAANAVEGATAQARLDSVHRIIGYYNGAWREVSFSAVSSATPAVIEITSLGGAGGSITYKVMYVPDEPAWATFPARVTETPLRVAQMEFYLGGTWDGSDFQGGKTLNAELRSIEYALANNLQVEFTPGATEDYASRTFRDGRQQTLTVNREFRDYLLQQMLDDNEFTLGARILAQGAVYDSPHMYTVDLVFPKIGVIKVDPGTDGKRLTEAAEFRVLEDDTYGSVIATVKNMQATYAA